MSGRRGWRVSLLSELVPLGREKGPPPRNQALLETLQSRFFSMEFLICGREVASSTFVIDRVFLSIRLFDQVNSFGQFISSSIFYPPFSKVEALPVKFLIRK